MYVYTNGDFEKRSDLQTMLDDAVQATDNDYAEALARLGFLRTNDYCHKDDINSLVIEVYVQHDSGLEHLKDYGYFIEWTAAGVCHPVLIASPPDYYDFLGRYLPVIKLAGELSFKKDWQ